MKQTTNSEYRGPVVVLWPAPLKRWLICIKLSRLVLLFALLLTVNAVGCRSTSTNVNENPGDTLTTNIPALASPIPKSTPTSTSSGGSVVLYDGQGIQDIFLYYAESKPDRLVIFVGDLVTWRNMDEHVYGISSDDGLFSGSIEPFGGTFSYTFTQPGTYWYNIDPYPNMNAQVVVLAP